MSNNGEAMMPDAKDDLLSAERVRAAGAFAVERAALGRSLEGMGVSDDGVKAAILHWDTLAALASAHDAGAGQNVPRPLAEWHPDDGPALWWQFPIAEPPYAGTPTDSDWPGYHTHWTPIPVPRPPEPAK